MQERIVEPRLSRVKQICTARALRGRANRTSLTRKASRFEQIGAAIYQPDALSPNCIEHAKARQYFAPEGCKDDYLAMSYPVAP